MPILKSEVRNKYTTIPNSVIQNCELSDGDFRLLIFLYSLPDGWKINQGYLGQKLGCSRININKKIRRIKESGYLEILKAKDSNTDYIYVLKEKDVSVNDVSLRDVSSRDVSLSDTHINNNIIKTNIINTKDNNISLLEISKNIIKHLNSKTGSKFKYTSNATKSKISARLNEGYKLDDFIVVIDKKYDEWHETEFEQYLCPETLFGTKFEKYLNQKVIKKTNKNLQTSPKWLDKKIKKEEVSDDEAKELEELLKGV